MIPLFLLIITGLSFGICPSGQNVFLDMSAETVDTKGKNYRRADVLIFIPIDREIMKKESLFLEKSIKIHSMGGKRYRVDVRLKNVSDVTIDDAYLEQKIENGSFHESIQAVKVLSRTPYIFEPISLYPTDITGNRVIVKLPPIKPGEELELSYTLSAKREPPVPKLKGYFRMLRYSKERIYILVAKYSFLFGYGKTKTKDLNFENIREILRGFKEAGLKPVVKVIGLADGKTRNPWKNSEVARRRAQFVAVKVLGNSYACYIRRGFAEDIR